MFAIIFRTQGEAQSVQAKFQSSKVRQAVPQAVGGGRHYVRDVSTVPVTSWNPSVNAMPTNPVWDEWFNLPGTSDDDLLLAEFVRIFNPEQGATPHYVPVDPRRAAEWLDWISDNPPPEAPGFSAGELAEFRARRDATGAYDPFGLGQPTGSLFVDCGEVWTDPDVTPSEGAPGTEDNPAEGVRLSTNARMTIFSTSLEAYNGATITDRFSEGDAVIGVLSDGITKKDIDKMIEQEYLKGVTRTEVEQRIADGTFFIDRLPST